MKVLWLVVWLLATISMTACASTPPPVTVPAASTSSPTSTPTPFSPTATPAYTTVPPVTLTVPASDTPAPAVITPLPATVSPTKSPAVIEQATPMEPQLIMVHIRARSATEVEALRRMKLDIIRITPIEPVQTPTTKDDFLNREFIVEAVVPVGMLNKLTNLGYDVTELPSH